MGSTPYRSPLFSGLPLRCRKLLRQQQRKDMNKRLIVLTFAISSVLGLVGCYVERPHEYSRGPAVGVSYSYVYYPDAEVYFEPHRHVYYWSDGGSWRSGERVPQNIVLRS